MTHSAQLLSGCGHVQHEPDGGGDGGGGGAGGGGKATSHHAYVWSFAALSQFAFETDSQLPGSAYSSQSPQSPTSRGHVQHLKPGGGAGGLGGGDGGLGSGASHQRYCSGLLGARQFALEFESQLSAGSNLMQLSQLTGSGARGHVQQPKLMGLGLGAPASEARVRRTPRSSGGRSFAASRRRSHMVRARGVRSTSSNSAN